jgi:murein DD-endopeptidase MepM/ murein hydrolase activator NlpD
VFSIPLLIILHFKQIVKLVRLLFIISIGLFFTIDFAHCQKKKGRKDFFKFKNKKIEQVQAEIPIEAYVDQNIFNIDTTYLDSIMWIEEFNLNKELSLLAADTAAFPLYYNIPVQVSEQLMIDSVWVVLREYYSIWDSRKVNPYKMDGEKFADTVNIPLHYEKPNLNWSVPIENGHITSPFGLRRWRWHYGSDLRLNMGDSVRAAFDGIVRVAHYDRYGYGHYVLIRHYNGLETLYGHFKKRLASVGDVVKAGEVIGLGGNTGRSSGPHLHFEVRYEGNALSPIKIFDFANNKLLTDTLTIDQSTFAYLKEARKIRYHRIRSGDTLSHISYRYGISINRICRLNRITRKTILRVGRRLRIV